MRIKRPRTGQRRTRVIFYEQSSSENANTDGEIPEDETELGSRWAEVTPIRGTERWLALQTQADVTYRVRVPYDSLTSALTPANWLDIKQTGRRLNISRVYDPDLRQRHIELECKERVE